jgi:virginiamycin A acetyltransferase
MQQTNQTMIRNLIEQVAALVTLPTWLAYQVQSRILGETRACLAISQAASKWSGFVGIYLRRALYRRLLAGVGDNVSISMGTILTKPTIRLGNSIYIGSYCMLGDVTIGDNTMLADQVSIISGDHGMDPDVLMKDQPSYYRKITIGEDCWVGSRATIMADLGNHCVVGAGSVVTKPVGEYMIVAGNPARPIGDRRERKSDRAHRTQPALRQNQPELQPVVQSW